MLQWKSNDYYIFWKYVCSLRYPAWNAHAPCCLLWSLRLYKIVLHYRINSVIFEKEKSMNVDLCVLIFSTAFVWNTSHSKKNSDRHSRTFNRFHVKHPPFLSGCNEPWILSKDFRKIFKIKFHHEGLSAQIKNLPTTNFYWLSYCHITFLRLVSLFPIQDERKFLCTYRINVYICHVWKSQWMSR